jgi:hypothetical protein
LLNLRCYARFVYIHSYCSRAHQRAHWRAGHKQECPTFAQRSKAELQTVELDLPQPPSAAATNNNSSNSPSSTNDNSSTSNSSTSDASVAAAAATELFPEFEVRCLPGHFAVFGTSN